MPTLAVTVLLVQFFLHFVSTVGAESINKLLWLLYNAFPTGVSTEYVRAQKLRGECLRLQRELKATSAQDEFARWAKLKRQYDKAFAEHEGMAQSLRATESAFGTRANALRWLVLNGGKIILQFRNGKTAIFWLPQGLFPVWAEWMLSFPKAPVGGVSIQIWFFACATVIGLAFEGIGGGVSVAMGLRGGKKEKEKLKMKVPAQSAPEIKEEKKVL